MRLQIHTHIFIYMKIRIITFFLLIITIAFSVELPAQKLVPIIVNADKPKAEIKSTMWGIFFEDINFGADGGIYAELVKNRSFEFYKPRTGWKINAVSRQEH